MLMTSFEEPCLTQKIIPPWWDVTMDILSQFVMF